MSEVEEEERIMTIGIDETKIPVTGKYDLNKMNLRVQRETEEYTRKQ